jgi:hypothetical protein
MKSTRTKNPSLITLFFSSKPASPACSEAVEVADDTGFCSGDCAASPLLADACKSADSAASAGVADGAGDAFPDDDFAFESGLGEACACAS